MVTTLRFTLPCLSHMAGAAVVVWQDHIVERPPPELVADKYSAEFRSFVAACMQKEPKKRATTTELMTHPFIQMWEHEPDTIVAELVK